MGVTPFRDVPSHRFLAKLLPAAAGILIVSFFLVGVVANSSAFLELKGPSAIDPFWISAIKHYLRLMKTLGNLPGVCVTGNTVNEFQVRQCNSYWDELLKSSALGVVPALAVFLFFRQSLDRLSSLYKKAEKKIQKGEAAFKGTITDPPTTAGDGFSWFYCLSPVMMELPDKTQRKVYVSLDSAVPLPGETFVAFEVGTFLGEKRHVAMLYAPHLAIVRGS